MKTAYADTKFHYSSERIAKYHVGGWYESYQDTEFTYTFENFFHPYVGELIQQLNTKSLAGLLDASYHASLVDEFFATTYTELASKVVALETFPKEIDLADGGPYANYNWELLFHVPLTIAVHLSKNQRFAEAQRWFHYIFDPTSNDMTVDPPARFWKFLRFRQDTDVQRIDDLLALLSKPDDECTPTETDLKHKVLQGYAAIMANPFQPHKVARTRTVAYQYSVVMKYLDNLIAWGDSLFMQDTIESINEATQLYVLAANLLGPRPQEVPPRGNIRPKTFHELKEAGLDAMGNAMVELEAQFPFDLESASANGDSDPSGALFGIGRTLYFCIPRNQNLLAYWDILGDRLFKIRHCLNIEGVFRQLPLFDPPIDPGMLVKAAAAGLDISSIVAGLNQPIGPVRCTLLIQKAIELTSEVKALGNALLAALEKGDAEHLGLMRQAHEKQILQLTQDVKYLQWRHAQEATETLLRTRASAVERYRHYQELLGIATDRNTVPDTFPLDRRELTEETFDEAYAALVGQYDQAVATQPYPRLRLADASSPGAQSGASGTGQLYLNVTEAAELNTHLPTARDTRLAASIVDTIASTLAFIPDFNVDLHYWGLGASSVVFGGTKLSQAGHISAEVVKMVAAWEADQAGMAARTAGYERRVPDWVLQHNLAAHELVQLGRQILSSLIAEQIALHEYNSVKQQIANAQEIDDFLHSKFTNEDLYGWMQGELARVYYEYYRFAFDTARKAERTMKLELMRPEVDATDYVKFNYWDGGRKGLLSGEALHLDLKRMEMAYHDNNKRELELTRHVSLRQLDPLALLTLKATGRCEVTIPEWLYDRDCPGHYMRRLKFVALSIPSVVGPYTSMNCTLSLLRSTVRRKPLLSDGAYARTGNDDDRFVDYFGSLDSVVTSSATNDAGMFETNLHDERFLPFEGAGAVSSWRLELPSDLRPFDYSTIADVILHVRYTARQGGKELGDQAIKELRDQLATQNQSGLALLFSLPHDFPTEWSRFLAGTEPLTIRLREDFFPYLVKSETLAIDALDLYAPVDKKLKKRTVPVPGTMSDDLNASDGVAELTIPPDATVLKREAGLQAFLIVHYSI
jgi:hypothetical protein